jgi:signal transduction histidine kinase
MPSEFATTASVALIPLGGSGLVGLSDRVAALGGSLDVRSPSGDEGRITAMVPLEPAPGAVHG